MTFKYYFALFIALAGGGSILNAAGPQPVSLSGWATVQNPKYGFSITYPANIFQPKQGKMHEAGQVFQSLDGTAQLLVGTFENDGAASLADYRKQLLNENYRGASVDFAPVRKSWFVVSGTRGRLHFYERVSFTCRGRFINSWALLYPADQRELYDKVVEAVAQRYSPGTGRTGKCD